MLASVLIEEQRAGGKREPAVRGVAVRRLGLVGVVQVVEPMLIDEAVLKGDGGYAPPARLQHQRASPPSRLRVGEYNGGLETIERGSGLVHGADRPRELQY